MQDLAAANVADGSIFGSWPKSRTRLLRPRLCCKTRKLQRQEFFAKTRSGRRSPICIPSVAVPKSPVSLTREDQSPHVLTRKTRLKPAEFLITCAKRLLQHNHLKSGLIADIAGCRFGAMTGLPGQVNSWLGTLSNRIEFPAYSITSWVQFVIWRIFGAESPACSRCKRTDRSRN